MLLGYYILIGIVKEFKSLLKKIVTGRDLKK